MFAAHESPGINFKALDFDHATRLTPLRRVSCPTP
jgi:hypothetical protein